METAIHFGAGAIGRGLLGDLLYESGYRLVFVDADEKLIKQINEKNAYELIEMEENNRRKIIDNVIAYNAKTQAEEIIEEIVNGKIITTSVRVENLKHIAPLMGKGLLRRYEEGKGTIDILAFENAYMASDILKQHILESNSELSLEKLKKVACFANTITDRVVMNIEENGKSIIQVGDSYEAAVEQNKLSDPKSKPIKDSVYTNNIEMFLDRKLYVVNGGHCACGYLGNLKKYTYMMDSFEDEMIYQDVKNEMTEVGNMITKKHNIVEGEIDDYIAFALDRYLTSKNDDFVIRVCRNPIRKLNSSDRLVGPALQAEAMGMPFSHIAKIIAAAFLYDNAEDAESVQIQNLISEKGIEAAITEITTIKKGSALFDEIYKHYEELNKGRN